MTAATGTRRARSAAGGRREASKLSARLVLNAWMAKLFEAKDAQELLDLLNRDELEGVAEDGVTHYARALTTQHAERKELPNDLLLQYDANIVRHWRAITERPSRREHRLKHFQYLALLFAEVYLHRYFEDRAALLQALNAHVETWNFGKAPGDQAEPFAIEELNKLAFLMATGSGKTLLMHVNIRQYLHYLERAGRRRELSRIILLTPNEGLSKQHLAEFAESGIEAALFAKEGRSLFSGQAVEIIDIHKLAEDSGTKTVAVEAFEGNNLVLVDEGHRGSSATGVSKETGVWMDRRRRLCEGGFSFEYSATFGQAIKPANKELIQEYGHCILFDYSYRFFHRDGYGKGFRILNLAEDRDAEQRRLYLVGCLLGFLQQAVVHQAEHQAFAPYLVEKPLWIFVGGTVTKSVSQKDMSDVADILTFLTWFVGDKRDAVAAIDRIMGGNPGLLDTGGREIFANRFGELFRGRTAEDVHGEALRRVFNAPGGGALHIEELKGTDGEIELRVGDAEPFGVVNVGDARKVVQHCAEKGLNTGDGKDFNDSLFRQINERESRVNVLIGAKKFSEGWSSWRVSTMGLMNVGRSEGSEIIQLFGRGVRLKGYSWSLKRSAYVKRDDDEAPPRRLHLLETLNVFGIRADYMQVFRGFLEEEGVPQDDDLVTRTITVINHLATGGAFDGVKLWSIGLKPGLDFKKDAPKPILDGSPHSSIVANPVSLDWFPRIQSRASKDEAGAASVSAKTPQALKPEHLTFFDWGAVWFELERFKAERSWHNLAIPRDVAERLLATPTWYRLYIPEEELEFSTFGRVRLWQEIAVALLKKYVERYYDRLKAEWEDEYLEYRELTPDDGNFFAEYTFQIHPAESDILQELATLETEVAAGAPARHTRGNFRSLSFDRHLYTPLVSLGGTANRVSPGDANLNAGERLFVEALQTYYERNPARFEGKKLYLLRNRSRARGLGFLEEAKFYPDFILWIASGGRSQLVLVDPKGLRNLDGLHDPKVRLAKTIKDREQRLGHADVSLESFIVSQTPYQQVAWWNGGITETELEAAHVLFPGADPTAMVGRMFALLEKPEATEAVSAPA